MSDEFVWEWVAWCEQIVLILIPALLLLTVWIVVIAKRRWPYRLPAVMAVKTFIVGGAVTWLAIPTAWRRAFGTEPPIYFYAITATVVLALCVVPMISVGYVVWLDWRRDGQPRRRRDDDHLDGS